MKTWKRPDNRAATTGIVVGNPSRLHTLKPLLIGASITVVIVTGLVWWRVSAHYADANRTANSETQKALAAELTIALRAPDNRAIITDTTQLIDGANDGKFVVSKDRLGWYYTDRANAYLNLKQYMPAASDFEKSAALNGELKASALQGEFEARYKAGERQQLIPLLQTLVALERKSASPVRGSLVNQYREYIRDLQRGSEVPL